MAELNLEKDKKLLVAIIGQIIEASAELKSRRSHSVYMNVAKWDIEWYLAKVGFKKFWKIRNKLNAICFFRN